MARGWLQGWAERGGETLTTAVGLPLSQFAQRSYPGAHVTVYLTGTTTLATLYSNIAGTPLGNPFDAAVDGSWRCVVEGGSYDVVIDPVIAPAFPLFGLLASPSIPSTLINVLDFGAVNGGDVDVNTTAFQAAYDVAGPHNIYWPAGFYRLRPLRCSQSRVNVYGDGPNATVLQFIPSAALQSPLTYQAANPAQVLYQCSAGGFSIQQTEGVLAKIGIDFYDVSGCYFHDIQIGPLGQWNGTSGGVTRAIRMSGRDLTQFARVECCTSDGGNVLVQSNPNTAVGGLEDFDVVHFDDCHFMLGASTHHAIEFVDGAQPSDVLITGGDTIGGAGTFKLVNTVSGSAAYGVTLIAHRGEGGANGAFVYIDGGATFNAIRGVRIVDCNAGGGTTQKGVYLRHCSTVSITDSLFLMNSGDAWLDCDTTVALRLRGNFVRGNAVQTMGANMALLRGDEKRFDSTSPGYVDEVWTSKTLNSNVGLGTATFLGGPVGGANIYIISNDPAAPLANNTQLSIPLGSGIPATKLVRIEVEAYGATKYAAGTAVVTALAPGVAPALLTAINGTNLFGVGNVGGKLTVFDGGSGMSTITLFNQTGESMNYTIAVRFRT